MTARRVARAVAKTSGSAPQWRVELRTAAHALIADERTTNGGANAGPSPFGLVLSKLAACTATTLRMYADRNTLTRIGEPTPNPLAAVGDA